MQYLLTYIISIVHGATSSPPLPKWNLPLYVMYVWDFPHVTTYHHLYPYQQVPGIIVVIYSAYLMPFTYLLTHASSFLTVYIFFAFGPNALLLEKYKKYKIKNIKNKKDELTQLLFSKGDLSTTTANNSD